MSYEEEEEEDTCHMKCMCVIGVLSGVCVFACVRVCVCMMYMRRALRCVCVCMHEYEVYVFVHEHVYVCSRVCFSGVCVSLYVYV